MDFISLGIDNDGWIVFRPPVCAALTPPPVQCSVSLSDVSVSLFSFDFYTCTFVVIVNVLGFLLFFRLFVQSEKTAPI